MSHQRDPRDATGSVGVFEDIWKTYLDNNQEPEFNPQERLFAERKFEELLRILPPAPATVLECGSGSAEVSAFLAHHGYTVTCLDDSPAALEFARKRFAREGIQGDFVRGNVYQLPFADNQFDVLTSFGLMEHFRDPDRVIAEMTRVIKPGGLFFADIVTDRFSVQRLGHYFNGLVRIVYYGLKGSPTTGWREARKLIVPEFYENTEPASFYVRSMEAAGLTDIVMRGNRPFPLLTLPGPIESLYVRLMRIAMPLWRRFDRAGSRWTLIWGAGWWAWGTRRTDS